MSIRSKLLVTYLLLTTLALGVLGSLDLWAYQNSFTEWAQADLAGRTTALAPSVADALSQGDQAQVTSLAYVNGEQEGVKVRVIGPDGHLLASSSADVDGQLADWRGVPGVAEALAGNPAAGRARGVFARGDVLYQATPIRRGGQLLGVLRTSLTLELFDAQLRQRLQTVFLTMSLSFLVCALVSLWLARSIATPIQAMRDFAVRVGSGQFHAKLGIHRGDELGQLAAELSRMNERLLSLDEERRSFLASVSHELRTPVSNVLVTLEALQSGADEDEMLRARMTTAARGEMLRLSKLIQDLLELGRLEAGIARLNLREVDLEGLVRRVLGALESRLREHDLRVACSVPPIRLEADSERLCQVLMNLLDNAIKHSPPGSVVRISAELKESVCALQIGDEGPGIAPKDLPHVFDQFFVGDPARTGSGTGLGLAIARRIVEAHGGSIHADSAAGQGTSMTIRVPFIGSPRRAGDG